MSTDLKFGGDARESLRLGAEKVYKAVSATLGARGRNFVWQKFGSPKITNDGVTIANEIDLADPFEKQGADLMKQAARKTVSEAGDGTTTSIVLAYSMFSEGLKLIEDGENPMVLRRKIEKEVEKVQAKLKDMAKPADDSDLQKVATISVENPEYGKIIAESVKTAGTDGAVVVEEDYKILGMKAEEVQGYRLDKGCDNRILYTDTKQAVLQGDVGEPIYVLVADKTWNLAEDLHPLFTEIKKSGADKLLIVTEEISGEALSYIVTNRIHQTFHAVVVKTPFNKDMLDDIAAVVGGEPFLAIKGVAHPTMKHLGKAQRVVVTPDTTTIIGGVGDPTEAIESLRKQVADADEGYEKEKLQERLARLTSKTINLHIGAATDAELRHLKDKVDDAIPATRAAMEEGVVAGGGMALVRIGEQFYEGSGVDHERLMYTALHAPLKKIMSNSGVTNDLDVFVELVADEKRGYDALEGKVVDNIFKAGIIDPVKVTRCALKNAASLACMLLTCDTICASIPDPENKP